MSLDLVVWKASSGSVDGHDAGDLGQGAAFAGERAARILVEIERQDVDDVVVVGHEVDEDPAAIGEIVAWDGHRRRAGVGLRTTVLSGARVGVRERETAERAVRDGIIDESFVASVGPYEAYATRVLP